MVRNVKGMWGMWRIIRRARKGRLKKTFTPKFELVATNMEKAEIFNNSFLPQFSMLISLSTSKTLNFNTYVNLFIHLYSKSFLARLFTILWNGSSSSIQYSCLGLPHSRYKTLHLGLVEPHVVPIDSLLELDQIPLDGILASPVFRRVNCTIQLSVICRLAEDALTLTVCVFEKDFKQHWLHCRPLKDATCHWSPFGRWASIKSFSNSFLPYLKQTRSLWLISDKSPNL